MNADKGGIPIGTNDLPDSGTATSYTKAEAEGLGAFEEDALSEQDALENIPPDDLSLDEWMERSVEAMKRLNTDEEFRKEIAKRQS